MFYDPESEIDHFMWAIGSQPGYDDIMAFTREESDCGENSRNNPLSLMEGHAYYISVKVRYFCITFTVKKLIDNFTLLNTFPNNISTKENILTIKFVWLFGEFLFNVASHYFIAELL